MSTETGKFTYPLRLLLLTANHPAPSPRRTQALYYQKDSRPVNQIQLWNFRLTRRDQPPNYIECCELGGEVRRVHQRKARPIATLTLALGAALDF